MRLINKLEKFLEDENYKIIIKERQVNILNFKEILDFSSNQISLRCKSQIINIEGKNMVITKMLDEEILITGIILNIRIN